jgi:hypothetical protein
VFVSSPTPLIALATGRIAVGATVYARPTVLAKGMGADSTTAERTAWVARMFAVRDLALGLGVLWALNRSRRGRVAGLLGGTDPALRELLLLGVLCDLGDAVAVGGALRSRSVRILPAGATLVTAIGAAAIGAREATR